MRYQGETSSSSPAHPSIMVTLLSRSGLAAAGGVEKPKAHLMGDIEMVAPAWLETAVPPAVLQQMDRAGAGTRPHMQRRKSPRA